MEQWKEIPGYDGGYFASNTGKIKSCKHNNPKILKVHLTHGHYSVSLCNNNKYKHEFVHRLVALAFIPNSKKLPLVNHKNNIKTDNRPENLEWCTAKHNTRMGRSFESFVVMDSTQCRIANVMIPMIKKLVPMNREEIWKEIEGYNGMYFISNFGRFASLKHGEKKIIDGRQGEYISIALSSNNASVKKLVHRLVAEYFIENPNNYPLVNHKDKNKYNNHVDNLEWCTIRENVIHARTHANFVSLGSKEGRFASMIIPQAQKAAPLTTTFDIPQKHRPRVLMGELMDKFPIEKTYSMPFSKPTVFEKTL